MKPIITVALLFVVLSACKKENPKYFQKKLVGDWEGTALNTTIGGGASWDVSFTFEENGHYTGAVLAIHYGDPTCSTFEGQDKDHPEKKLIINYIDSFGKGHGTIKNYYSNGGNLTAMSINDLEFSDNFEKLSFEIYYGPSLYYELTRK